MSQTPDPPIDVRRVLMDRARQHAERDALPSERPVLPRVIGVLLALLVMLVLLLAFDRFLASVQRFLDLPVVDPEPATTEPMPVFVVPDDQPTKP